MLQFSQQHRIINDISLSFQKNEKIHTKISEKILERDIQFLKPKKYESYTEPNFKFIILWTVFKNLSSKIDTLKIVNSYDKEQIKEIMKEKEKIILYKNTFKQDKITMSTKLISKDLVFEMYNKNQISVLYVYWYFYHNTEELSRIQKKLIQKINFFMSFFPSICKELENE